MNSHFKVSGRGNNSETSRCGTPSSGVYGNIKGHRSGVLVTGHWVGNRDEFRIYKTSGSSASIAPEFIGIVTMSKSGTGVVFIPASGRRRQ